MPKPTLESAMAAAKTRLDELGIEYDRPAHTHLKIGSVNYYPSTGTVFVDGEAGRRPGRGPEVLETVLVELRLLQPNHHVAADVDAGRPRVIMLHDVLLTRADRR
jgi:hypothetical protein